MEPEAVGDITEILKAIGSGDRSAPDRLMRLVYGELRKIAANRLRSEGLAAAYEPTTLVQEAYVKLFARDGGTWENRHHFFWAAARAMRDNLVERARRNAAQKRGGGQVRVNLEDQAMNATLVESEDLLSLDEALQKLERLHPMSARVVMLRFFAGLNREEIAEQLKWSEAAVWREWNFAKAWLHAEIEGSEAK